MPVAEVRDLYKTYQMGAVQVHALRGVTIPFNQGDYVAIQAAIDAAAEDVRRDIKLATDRLGMVFAVPQVPVSQQESCWELSDH